MELSSQKILQNMDTYWVFQVKSRLLNHFSIESRFVDKVAPLTTVQLNMGLCNVPSQA